MERRYTISTTDGQDTTSGEGLITSSGKKKRIRKAYSCGNCRYRKIKCERTFPCQQCHLRNIASSCSGTTLAREYIDADERKKQFLKYKESMKKRQTSSSGTNVESPINTSSAAATTSSSTGESKEFSPAEATLESMYRTVDYFHDQITLVEQQVNSARAASSSSATQVPLRRSLRHRHSTSSIYEMESVSTVQDHDAVLRQLRDLERKVDLIWQRLDSQTAITRAPPAAIPPLPPEQSQASTSSANPFGLQLGNITEGDVINDPGFLDNISLDPAIGQWLQQEASAMQAGPSTRQLPFQQQMTPLSISPSNMQTDPPIDDYFSMQDMFPHRRSTGGE